MAVTNGTDHLSGGKGDDIFLVANGIWFTGRCFPGRTQSMAAAATTASWFTSQTTNDTLFVGNLNTKNIQEIDLVDANGAVDSVIKDVNAAGDTSDLTIVANNAQDFLQGGFGNDTFACIPMPSSMASSWRRPGRVRQHGQQHRRDHRPGPGGDDQRRGFRERPSRSRRWRSSPRAALPSRLAQREPDVGGPGQCDLFTVDATPGGRRRDARRVRHDREPHPSRAMPATTPSRAAAATTRSPAAAAPTPRTTPRRSRPRTSATAPPPTSGRSRPPPKAPTR